MNDDIFLLLSSTAYEADTQSLCESVSATLSVNTIIQNAVDGFGRKLLDR